MKQLLFLLGLGIGVPLMLCGQSNLAVVSGKIPPGFLSSLAMPNSAVYQVWISGADLDTAGFRVSITCSVSGQVSVMQQTTSDAFPAAYFNAAVAFTIPEEATVVSLTVEQLKPTSSITVSP